MSEWIKIRNWEKWQSYRRDRGQPPWIKVHREVMRNPDWVALSDAQRGQLVAIWLLAADRDGVIPASPTLIQKLCYLDSVPDLQVFAERGFIEIDAAVASTWRQCDETEAETEAETEGEKTLLSKRETAPVSDLWEIWLSELGGNGRKPTLTAARSKALSRLWHEQLAGEEEPMEAFRRVLRAVQRSDHHMSQRAYQYPDSLFRNEERRDRWMTEASTNGKQDLRPVRFYG